MTYDGIRAQAGKYARMAAVAYRASQVQQGNVYVNTAAELMDQRDAGMAAELRLVRTFVTARERAAAADLAARTVYPDFYL